MRYLAWFVKIVLFLLFFAFALKNTDTVTLNGLLGSKLQTPLIVLLLVFFVSGVVLGVLAMLAQVFSVRRELAETRKALAVYTNRPAPKSADRVEPAEPLDAVV